jgi:cell pole-organizing protein PopZ
VPPPAPPQTPPSSSIRAGRTIDDIALEALEPMLQAWLDRHLREIVERRVQEEIDRISRKSES